MTAKYTEEFLTWYNNLSDDEYRSHYYAWLERDACFAQQRAIRMTYLMVEGSYRVLLVMMCG